MNSHKETTRKHERFTFERFCRAASIDIAADSIAQPEPPAPDILAVVVGEGPRAFELVRLDDDDYLAALNRFLAVPAILERAFEALSAERLGTLKRRYADAELTLHVDTTFGERDVRAALPRLWKILEELPDRFEGAKDLRLQRRDPLEHMLVVRTLSVDRRLFRVIASGFPSPVRADRITRTLQKRYETAEPLELLAYCHAGELAFVADPAALEAATVEHLPTSQFRRVWIYEGLIDRVSRVFEQPPTHTRA